MSGSSQDAWIHFGEMSSWYPIIPPCPYFSVSYKGVSNLEHLLVSEPAALFDVSGPTDPELKISK